MYYGQIYISDSLILSFMFTGGPGSQVQAHIEKLITKYPDTTSIPKTDMVRTFFISDQPLMTHFWAIYL